MRRFAIDGSYDVRYLIGGDLAPGFIDGVYEGSTGQTERTPIARFVCHRMESPEGPDPNWYVDYWESALAPSRDWVERDLVEALKREGSAMAQWPRPRRSSTNQATTQLRVSIPRARHAESRTCLRERSDLCSSTSRRGSVASSSR
jgi:hypothetical protein